ncbi:MAG TPA: S41 family peptidase, partial [Gaiellaceae bacterium]|nr:S41 family peptidase [Gaiellaceae bacterium]
MRLRRPLLFLAAGLVLVGPFALGYRLSQASRATGPVAIPSVVDEVREALALRYYRPVPTSVLHLGSVDQMLSALGDPYTAYLGPSDYRLLRQQTASRYSGIGASVLPSANGLVVVSLRPGPAQRAGVHTGDTIVRIGSTPTGRLGMAGAFARILGPPGTRVRLELLRGARRLDLSVRRAIVQAPVVEAKLLSYAGRRWGLVRLSAFRIGAAVVLRRQLRLLEREGANGLVLDLRQNPGGLLDQAVAVSSLFLDHGIVVTLAGAHSPRHVYRAFPGIATKLPLVVL